MTQAERQGIIKQVVGEIVTLVHPVKVLLFGSAADKKNKETSDLDFLIVVSDQQDPNQTLDRLNLGVKTRVLPCDFVVATEKMIKKYGQRDGLVYREALTSGIVLYAA